MAQLSQTIDACFLHHVFAQALEQSKWFSLAGLHCEKVLHKRFARMGGAVFEVQFLVGPVD